MGGGGPCGPVAAKADEFQLSSSSSLQREARRRAQPPQLHPSSRTNHQPSGNASPGRPRLLRRLHRRPCWSTSVHCGLSAVCVSREGAARTRGSRWERTAVSSGRRSATRSVTRGMVSAAVFRTLISTETPCAPGITAESARRRREWRQARGEVPRCGRWDRRTDEDGLDEHTLHHGVHVVHHLHGPLHATIQAVVGGTQRGLEAADASLHIVQHLAAARTRTGPVRLNSWEGVPHIQVLLIAFRVLALGAHAGLPGRRGGLVL